MLTKNQIKLIKSLHEKKYRNEYGLFLVEGVKSVSELISSDFIIDHLLTTPEFFNNYKKIIADKNIKYDIVDQEELEKVSAFESNDSALAVVKQKENIPFETSENEIIVALDEIKDPGNLGTIIRIADWYGVKKIVASENTTDLYNNKVISASMGSFTRVSLFYTDLKKYLSETKLPILGAFLKGENVHTTEFPKKGILLMGNESNGISKELEKIVTKKITIPAYGETESLNVAISTAVILDNWKRNL